MEIESREKEKRTLSYYDENAAAFCEGTRNADMSEMRGRFLRYLKPGALILDAGCGSGRDSKAFMESGYRVVAIDGSEKICRLASKYLGQEVQCRRFEKIEEKEVYDGIWACASLLHVPHELLPKVIARLITALVDGGVLYASFKYGEEEREAGGRYFTDLREDGWKKVLEEAEEEMKGNKSGSKKLETIECFVTGDVREGRGGEKWLNVVGRKVRYKNWYMNDADEKCCNTEKI